MALLLLLLAMLLTQAHCCKSQPTITMQMVHRHSRESPLGLRFATPRHALEDLLAQDAARRAALDLRRRSLAAVAPSSATAPAQTESELPLASAAQLGTALYFVDIWLGTPPQNLTLVADTGSDLVWTNCAGSANNDDGVAAITTFSPDNSSTASYVACFSSACAAVSPDLTCIFRPKMACEFIYSYMDGSSVSGPYLRDIVTPTMSLGGNATATVSLGCGTTLRGFSSPSSASGVLGLGPGATSFPWQTRQIFGGVFSYCLANYTLPIAHKSSLILGRQSHAANLSYTPMVGGVGGNASFYYVDVEGVALGGESLTVPLDRLQLDGDGNGGTIIDSGTSLTYLEEDTFNVVMEAIRAAAVLFPTAKTSDPAGFELCFNFSGGGGRRGLPDMAITLAGGAVLSVPPENYLVSVEADVQCVGVMSVTWPSSSIMGSVFHQNYLVEYDLNRQRLGFVSRRC